MAMNVCPKCRQVTLSLGEVLWIKCSICEVEFEVNGKEDHDESKK